MLTPSRSSSGRPQSGEYASYAQADLDFVPGEDAVAALEALVPETLAFLGGFDEAFAATFRYAPDKWTVKQVVGHMIDDERIFAYRALCVARGDRTAFPGFDEKEYVRHAGFEARTLSDLLAEYRAVREATLALFRTFSPEAWRRTGTVNGYAASVRGLAFHLAGHELHHLRILRERYRS